MTRVITLPGLVTDLTLPIRRKDPRLFAGHLALIDPTNPSAPWSAGLPADTAAIPNVAQREARDVLANQTAEVRPVVAYSAAFTGTAGKVERTGLGALHGISSQATSTSGVGFEISLPAALKTYLVSTYDNARYMSLWYQVTRASAGSPTATNAPHRAAIAYTTTPASSYAGYFKTVARRPASPVAVTPTANDAATLDAAGSRVRLAMTATGHTGTAPANAAELFAAVASFGRIGVNNTGITDAARASWVLYGWSVIDLTVAIATDPRLAGKTVAEAHAIVDAADQAAYTRLMTTAGGRYFGDTIPTDPSTIA